MSSPLAGIRVAEFCHVVMGPTCGLVLADLGAEVIKVEPPEGDHTRKLVASGAGFFPTYNRNKKSFAADLKDAARLAIDAGSDMDMESGAYLTHLGNLVQSGQVRERRLQRFHLAAAARTMGISGPVELEFTVGADGAVKDVRVIKGHPVLGSAATEAVLRWHYEPARLNGIAVETRSSK